MIRHQILTIFLILLESARIAHKSSGNKPFFLCNMPSLLKFKSWVSHLSGTNINNTNLFVVESLKISNKTLQEEGIYVYFLY